eukprot:gene30984-37447_t
MWWELAVEKLGFLKAPWIGNHREASSNRHLTETNDSIDSKQERIYFLKKVVGPGCPYTASWLAHVNLYRRVKYWIDITKMEAATFSLYDRAKLKFQLSDPHAYFVHHMSMYEHLNHKAYGFEVAHNKSIILAQSAVRGECGGLKVASGSRYLALIPFYGGLPPNVTKDLSVKSIGQGNSLVDASTKAMQTMATLCSCLKHFGTVIVGVTRNEDRALIEHTIQQLDSKVRQHINVVQFRLARPAFLPFHLLAWGQYFIKHHNCHRFYKSVSEHTHSHNNVSARAPGSHHLGFIEEEIDVDAIPKSVKEFEICLPQAITPYTGGPIQVLYMRKPANFIEKIFNKSHEHDHTTHMPLLSYVYYTECDQIVYFDSPQTLEALTAASNETTFFTGRRKEKGKDSDPSDYMGGLNQWRECGSVGYSLTWPRSEYVYEEK